MSDRTVRTILTAEDRTKAGFASTKRGLDGLVKASAVVGVALAGAAVAAAGAATVLARRGLEQVDALAKQSDMLGITTEAMAGLQYAASLSGASTEQLTGSIQRMNKGIFEATQGTGEARVAIAGLGLSAEQLRQAGPEQAFEQILQRLEQVPNAMDRSAMAMKIFGEGAGPLLNMTADGLRSARTEAEDLGLAVSRIDAAKVEAANDAMTRARSVLTGVGRSLAVELSPYISAAANQLGDMAKESGGFKDEIRAGMDVAVTGAEYLAKGLAGSVVVYRALHLKALDFQQTLWETLRAARAVNLAIRERYEKTGLTSYEGTIESRRILGEQNTILTQIAANREAALAAGADALAMYENVDQRVAEFRRRVLEASQAAGEAKAASLGGGAGGGEGGGGGLEGELDRLDKIRHDNRIARMQGENAQRLFLEEQKVVELRRLATEEDEIARIGFDNRMQTMQAENEQREFMTQMTLDRLRREVEAEQASNQLKSNMQLSAANNAIGLLNVFSGKSKAAALAALVLQQGLAIGQTFVSGKAAEIRALAELGPIAGPPMAAVIKGWTMANIGMIAATGIAQAAMSGGGGGNYGGGTPGSPIVTQPLPQQQQQPQEMTIVIKGIVDDAFVEQTLIPKLNDAGSRNVRIEYAAA